MGVPALSVDHHESTASQLEWAQTAAQAPKLAATASRYLRQASTFLAPLSIEVADNTLRQLCRFLLAHTDITAVADIVRDDVEDFKVWLASQPGNRNTTLSANTQRQRIGMLRVFFERIIEWNGPTPRSATRSSDATSQRDPTRCPSSSTTAKQPK